MIFLIVELLQSRNITPYSFLLILYILSAVSGLIVSADIMITNNYEAFILIFTNLYMLCLIYPFKTLKRVRYVTPITTAKFKMLVKVINKFSFVGLVLTTIYGTVSILFFRTISVGVGEFKNGGIANSYIESVFPSWLNSILGFTMPFAFLSLGLHFYYLSQNENKKSTISLLMSLSIPLGSLVELSRGRFVLFLVLYLLIYFLLKNTFSRNIKQIVKRIFIIIFVPLLFGFIFISNDRFSQISYSSEHKSEINPVTHSLMDYLGQWHVNSFEVLKSFDDSKIMNGSRFGYFYRRIQRMFGEETIEQFDLDIQVFGNYGTQFRGVVSNIIYDLGYFGSVLFLLFFYFMMRKLKFINNSINLNQIFLYIILALFVSFFYQGNIMVYSMLSFAILYMLLSFLYLKVKLK